MTEMTDCRRPGLRLLHLTGSIAVALVCLAAAGGCAAATGKRSLLRPGGNRYGVISAVNGLSLFQALRATWGAEMASMHQEGVQEVRSDAAWGDIQPYRPGSSGPEYQWSSYDAWVTALADNHLRWQPIIDYNTGWTTAIADNSGFAAFARAVAARYGVGGTFWSQHPELRRLPATTFEIWNEEQGDWTYIPAIDYGPLYMAARSAIHAVDPSASVDIGGLAEDSEAYEAAQDWASKYMAALLTDYPQLRTEIDGVALHPYALSAGDAELWVAHFRKTLSSYDVPWTVPLDLTEFGWQYQAGSEAWRAAQMSILGNVFSRSSCGIREVAPYDWINPTGSGDFGLADLTSTGINLRPAAAAWFSALATGASQSTNTLCPPAPSASVTWRKSAAVGVNHGAPAVAHKN